ncbi:universal stress protein [Rhodococcus artemisiae]|uniref:Universal stress protein n=1 Tax=Rhodococcus artemisiae TaxID=714159 RepID=A0ABU7L9L5_9NOCA|nr:universal stress protein [Rhodococcus artemisiae]MEE2058248.1 universal stress protein [Rhodococcus artemisiae]
MNWTALWVFIGVWVLTGLATGLWMARKGHDPRWTIIAVILGPLFVPIAFERIERSPRSVASEPVAMWDTDSEESGGLRVMVGFDGSKHAEQALRTARKLFAPGGGVLELVAVVSYDDGADVDSEVLARAKQRLEAAAAGTDDVPVGYAVIAGPAGQSLRWFATEQHADVLVIGKRGRGLSKQMMGSVAAYLTEHCPVPVLVVDPTQTASAGQNPSAPVALRVPAEEVEESTQ